MMVTGLPVTAAYKNTIVRPMNSAVHVTAMKVIWNDQLETIQVTSLQYYTYQISSFIFASRSVHHLCFSEDLLECQFRLKFHGVTFTYDDELNALNHECQAHAKAHCCNEDLIRQDDVEPCRVSIRRGSDATVSLTLRQELIEQHQQHEHCVHGCIHDNVHCLYSSKPTSCFALREHWLFDQYATPVWSVSATMLLNNKKVQTISTEWWCKWWRTRMLGVQREDTEQCRSLWTSSLAVQSTLLALANVSFTVVSI